MQQPTTMQLIDEAQRALALRIARDLDGIADPDGLDGGDCVEYIYNLLSDFGVIEVCLACGMAHAPGPCPHCPGLNGIEVELSSTIDIIDGKLTGPRDEMLLLARTIHDVLEGGS